MQELLQDIRPFSEEEIAQYRTSFYKKHPFLSFLLFLPIFPPIGIVFWFLIRKEDFILEKSERTRNIISFFVAVFFTAGVFFAVGIPLLIYFLIKEVNKGLASAIGETALLIICQPIFLGLYNYHNKILIVRNPGKVSVRAGKRRMRMMGREDEVGKETKTKIINIKMANINWRHNLIIKVIGIISVAVLFLGFSCQIVASIIIPIISQYTMILTTIVFIPLIILQAILLISRFHKLDKIDKIFLASTFLAPIANITLFLLISWLWDVISPHSYVD